MYLLVLLIMGVAFAATFNFTLTEVHNWLMRREASALGLTYDGDSHA